jgi:hypothetical protein
MDWRERWEDDSQAEYDQFCELALETLLARVATMKLGSHCQIWEAIAAKEDLRTAGWPLFGFVSSGAPYLHRYHCAAALLTLLKLSKYQAAQLTVEHLNPARALADVAKILASRVGPRPCRSLGSR